MSWVKNLSPKHVQELIPYASAGRDPYRGDVWLNANENPYARTMEGLSSAFNRYPEFQPQALLEAYAEYASCSADQLLVTRGIDEGIDLLLRAFCESGRDWIIFTPPTYGMYGIAAESLNIESKPIPLQADFQLNVEAFQDIFNTSTSNSKGPNRYPYPKLIFLCSPNNPTGNLLKQADLLKILEMASGKSLVVLDEAYIEFSINSTLMNELKQYENLVIARTLSKGFGLAGLRTGFLAASPDIIHVLRKILAPYPIPVPVVDIAHQALTEKGIAHMQEEVAELRKGLELLKSALIQFEFVKSVLPSTANFILLKVENSQKLLEYLRADGIIVRDQSKQMLLENCIRISSGTQAEMSRLITSLKLFGEGS
jgi:histidinol-phosphate aminotransferase